VGAFRKKLSDSKFEVFVHMPYLPNLSSPDGTFYSKSIQVLQREIRRCGELGIRNLVLHFGSHMGTSIESGKERIVSACGTCLAATKNLDVRLLLENSADPKSVGSSFKTIGEVLELIKNKKRMGVCLDSCHAFASDYDLSSASSVEKTVEAFDSLIGLSNLYLIHLNDSKGKLGSGLDRHESIGKGNIGRSGMSAILSNEKLKSLPVILETPKDYDGEDRENIKTTKLLADA
jgi:deoxyribonuclease IV